MNIPTWLYWLTGITLFCTDRLTKYKALLSLSDTAYQYNAYLSFDLVFNRGISWGMFHSESTPIFAIVSCIIALATALITWHAYTRMRRGLPIIGHLLIITGSLSNLIDRVYYNGVIDFILLSYKQYQWPLFNGADIAIVIGICILVFNNET